MWAACAILLLLGAFALWYSIPPQDSPPFFVGSNTIPVKVQPSITVGHQFAAMIAPDGTLWLWGAAGSLPLNEHVGSVPKRFGNDTDWKQVTAGFYGLLALKQDGTLWAVGKNTEGILGLGPGPKGLEKMTRIGTEADWKEIRAGVAHCLALKQDGSLWAWGKNDYGQVGTGYTSPVEPIRRVGTNSNWTAISPAAMASYAMQSDGTLWGWGSDVWTNGINPWPTLLGPNQWKAISAGEYHIVALDTNGYPWATGPNAHLLAPKFKSLLTNWARLEHSTNWLHFVSGENCVVARSAGAGWGRSGQEHYRMGKPWKIPSTIDPLLVHSQRHTSYLLMKDGRLWSWEMRVGAQAKQPLLQALRDRLGRLVGKDRKEPDVQVDSTPVLLWTHQQMDD